MYRFVSQVVSTIDRRYMYHSDMLKEFIDRHDDDNCKVHVRRTTLCTDR